MITLSAYWHPELKAALQKKMQYRKKPFTASLVGEDEIAAVTAAVNQGIDAHLEACYVPQRGDRYERGERFFIATVDGPKWKKGDRVVHTVTMECSISPESLPVLVRRLMESGDDAGESLARSICDVLGIELV